MLKIAYKSIEDVCRTLSYVDYSITPPPPFRSCKPLTIFAHNLCSSSTDTTSTRASFGRRNTHFSSVVARFTSAGRNCTVWCSAQWPLGCVIKLALFHALIVDHFSPHVSFSICRCLALSAFTSLSHSIFLFRSLCPIAAFRPITRALSLALASNEHRQHQRQKNTVEEKQQLKGPFIFINSN